MRAFLSARIRQLLAIVFTLLPVSVIAQMPTCPATGGKIYIHSGGIYDFDPALPMSASNPATNTISMPGGANGLAVSSNLNAASPSPTFYTIVSNNIYYYNGTTWVNTLHSAGNASAVNIGAGGGFLYNLVGGTGEIYKYNGSSNAMLLMTITDFNGGGPYDLVGDCSGSFYILNTTTAGATPQYLRKYSSTGTLQQQWSLIGAPQASAGGGMAIIGNTVYYHNGGGYMIGTMGASSISFSSGGTLSVSPSDFASCQIGTGGGSITASIDTGYYCGTPVAITANGGSGYMWTVISGTATIAGSGTSITVTPTTNAKVELTGTNCGTSKDTITILITDPPVVTTPVTYCQNATASPLTATGTSLKWYTTATGGTGSTTAPTPATTNAGSTNYYVSQTIGCESNRSMITVNITAAPVAPSVTTPVVYCQNATASPLTATGSNLKWYTTATGGTGSTTAPTPATSSSGTTNHYVSQTVNGCEGSRALIAVNIITKPAPPTGQTSYNYCPGQTATQLTATGSSLLWYTTAIGGTGSSTAPTPNTTGTGTYNYYVSQTVNGCESDRLMITVIVGNTATAPAVTNVTYCQFQPAVPVSATGTNLIWYVNASGPATYASAPTPSTSAPGTTTYYVTQTTSGCESARSPLTVTITVKPVAPSVLSNIFYCQSVAASPLLASGSNLLWYANASGGTGNTTAPTPSTANAGTSNYYVSQTVAGCESDRAQISVTVNPKPAPPAVATPNIAYCQNVTPATIIVNGQNLIWYTTATGGSGNSAQPAINTSTVGTSNLYVSQTTNGCESDRAPIAITIHPIPAPPLVVTPVMYCQYAMASPVTATGSNLLWYANATGGTGSVSAPVPNTMSTLSSTYHVSQTMNGCESNRAPLTVNITPQPSMPVAPAVSYCQYELAIPLSANGANLKWYTTATGQVPLSSAPTPSTFLAGTYTWYVSQTVSGCESERTTVSVVIKPKPAPPTVNTPVHYCQYDINVPAITGIGQNLRWYDNPTGGAGATIPPVPNVQWQDTIDWWMTQTVNGCESDRILIQAMIHYRPNGIILSKKPIVCQYETDTLYYFGNADASMQINWKLYLGKGTVIAQPAWDTIVVRFDSAGVIPVRMQVSNHGCVSPEYTLQLNVHPVPVVQIDTKPEICFDETSIVALNYATPNIIRYAWDFNGGQVKFGSYGGGPYGIKWPQPGVYTIKVKASSRECTSPDYTASVRVHALPDGKILGISNNDFCAGDTTILTAATKQDGTYRYEWEPKLYFNYGLGADVMDDRTYAAVTRSEFIHLTVTDKQGCKGLDSAMINIAPCCEVYLPTAFTPNGDGRNDVFRIISNGHHAITMFRIVNRWGQTVWEAADEYMGWDGRLGGKEQEAGTYFYYLKYQCVNKEFYEQKGELTLIR